MEIKIEMPQEMCDKILKRYDYVTEKTILYYDEFEHYSTTASRYIPCEYIVAYPRNKRPEVLNDDKPLLKNCKTILWNNVIQSLFNKRLFEAMFNNF